MVLLNNVNINNVVFKYDYNVYDFNISYLIVLLSVWIDVKVFVMSLFYI